MEIMDLVNQKVNHKNFGVGIIDGVYNEKYLNVKFESKENICKFAYPQCFYGFLTLNDSDLQGELTKVIEDWKEENGIEKKERLQLKYQKTLQGIESRRNAAAQRQLKASQRAAEHRLAYNMKRESDKNSEAKH